MRRNYIQQLVLFFACLIISVSCNREENACRLKEMEHLISENPQMALDSLNKIRNTATLAGHATYNHYLLCLADAQNKAGAKVVAPNIFQSVVTYYENAGTIYDQVRAYYLMGSSYRDAGESIKALEAYNKALELAEFGQKDEIMYSLLSRIHGQMAQIYIAQRLPVHVVKSCENACKYSLLAKDTTSAAIFLGGACFGYKMQNDNQASVAIILRAQKILRQVKNYQLAAMCSSVIIEPYLKLGQYDKAKDCILSYEKYSGVFDKDGNIEKGREVFYYDKGLYFMAVNQLDSAECYFRKALKNKNDGDCQEGGHRSLYLLYKKIGNKDSLAKYADLAYQINDKRVLELSTREIQNMQQLYNYTRNQELAKQEQMRADGLKRWLIVVVSFCLLGVMFGILVYRHYAANRSKERENYKAKLEELAEAKRKQQLLADNRIEQMSLDNERQIRILEKQLVDYQNTRQLSVSQMKEDEVQASSICQHLHRVGCGLSTLEVNDWKELEKLLFDEFPSFKLKMMAVKNSILIDDYQLCLLARVRFTPSEIGNILGVKPSNVTMKRKRMLNALFDKIGNAKEFDKLLLSLC